MTVFNSKGLTGISLTVFSTKQFYWNRFDCV